MAITGESARRPYGKRIGRVADYIHEHLEDEIDLDILADVACMSRFHWHRIYTAIQGETAAGTVRRLRLSRAAERLANSDMTMSEIAARAGYTTPEAFGRAFREAYGQAPGSFRDSGSHAKFKAANAKADAKGFPVHVEDVPPLHCAAVHHSGSYMLISKAMGQLFEAMGAANLFTGRPRMIGLYLDDPDCVAEKDLRSMACSPVNKGTNLPAPLEAVDLRSGPYAKLRYKGPYADMKDAYRWLLGVWLPQSGREAADAPIFEEYLNHPAEVAPTELLTGICVPLEPS
jgi:AraC family transcriptional regulator